jgi:hypothetical protein
MILTTTVSLHDLSKTARQRKDTANSYNDEEGGPSSNLVGSLDSQLQSAIPAQSPGSPALNVPIIICFERAS